MSPQPLAAIEPPTARHMIELLRAHYLAPGRPPAGMFLPEIEAPGGKRRADLIWQGCTAAGGSQLIGHEVKVKRSDLLAELADGTKSDPWQRYCHRWWLVVPDRGIVDGLELPPTWGVLLPPSGRRTRTMTVLRDAPLLQPDDQAPALRRIATVLHWRRHDAEQRAAQADRELERLRAINDELRRRAPAASPERGREEQVVAEIVARLGGVDFTGRVGQWGSSVSVDDVVAALTDLGTANARAQSTTMRAAGLVRDLRRVIAGVDSKQLAEVERAAKALAREGDDQAAPVPPAAR